MLLRLPFTAVLQNEYAYGPPDYVPFLPRCMSGLCLGAMVNLAMAVLTFFQPTSPNRPIVQTKSGQPPKQTLANPRVTCGRMGTSSTCLPLMMTQLMHQTTQTWPRLSTLPSAAPASWPAAGTGSKLQVRGWLGGAVVAAGTGTLSLAFMSYGLLPTGLC